MSLSGAQRIEIARRIAQLNEKKLAHAPVTQAQIARMGEWIAAYRWSLGWRQVDLAYAAGVSVPCVCRYERGHIKEPSRDTVERIAFALGVDLEKICPFADRLTSRKETSRNE